MIYEELKKTNNKWQETKLSISQGRMVHPEVLIKILENFRDRSYSKVMKDEGEVMKIISSIKHMAPGGDGRMFICHNNEMHASKLEFACVAIQKYMYNDIEVCDYLVTTYSYGQRINCMGVATGGLTSTLGFGALIFGVATGGIGFAILGHIASFLGLGTMAISYDITVSGRLRDIPEASFVYELVERDCTVSSRFRDILEAAFVYELVERGYTEVQNGKLYLKTDDRDPSNS